MGFYHHTARFGATHFFAQNKLSNKLKKKKKKKPDAHIVWKTPIFNDECLNEKEIGIDITFSFIERS
jgi:hypothetical protein